MFFVYIYLIIITFFFLHFFWVRLEGQGRWKGEPRRRPDADPSSLSEDLRRIHSLVSVRARMT